MRSLHRLLKVFFTVSCAVTVFMLFSVVGFAADSTGGIEKLSDKELFIFISIIAVQILLILVIEFAIGLRRYKRARYPKEETAEVENLLSKATREDFVKHKNGAVVLGVEPEPNPLPSKEWEKRKALEKLPTVTEKILGVEVNQTTRIDLIDGGNSVKERFADTLTATESIGIADAKTVKPWGTLAEGETERQIFITVEEQKPETDTKLDPVNKFDGISVEEVIDNGVHAELGGNFAVDAIREGNVVIRDGSQAKIDGTRSASKATKSYTPAYIDVGNEKRIRNIPNTSTVIEDHGDGFSGPVYDRLDENPVDVTAAEPVSTLSLSENISVPSEKAKEAVYTERASAKAEKSRVDVNNVQNEEYDRLVNLLRKKLDREDKETALLDDDTLKLINRLVSMRLTEAERTRESRASRDAILKYNEAVRRADTELSRNLDDLNVKKATKDPTIQVNC